MMVQCLCRGKAARKSSVFKPVFKKVFCSKFQKSGKESSVPEEECSLQTLSTSLLSLNCSHSCVFTVPDKTRLISDEETL